jgi:hypothetical protein
MVQHGPTHELTPPSQAAWPLSADANRQIRKPSTTAAIPQPSASTLSKRPRETALSSVMTRLSRITRNPGGGHSRAWTTLPPSDQRYAANASSGASKSTASRRASNLARWAEAPGSAATQSLSRTRYRSKATINRAPTHVPTTRTSTARRRAVGSALRMLLISSAALRHAQRRRQRRMGAERFTSQPHPAKWGIGRRAEPGHSNITEGVQVSDSHRRSNSGRSRGGFGRRPHIQHRATGPWEGRSRGLAVHAPRNRRHGHTRTD